MNVYVLDREVVAEKEGVVYVELMDTFVTLPSPLHE